MPSSKVAIMSVPIAKPMTPFAVYKRLFRYTYPSWRMALLALVGMILYAATEPALAALLRPLLDGGFVERDMATIRMVPIALVAIFFLRGIGGYITSYGLDYVNRTMIKDLRRDIFDKWLKLPTSHFDRTPSSLMLSKLTYEVNQVSSIATQAVQVLVKDTLIVLGLIGLMFYHSPILSLLTLVSAPIIAVMTVYLSRKFRRANRRIQDAVGQVATVAKEALDGHRVVKVFNGETYERARFERVNEDHSRQSMRLARTRAANTPITQFVAASSFALVIYLATSSTLFNDISPGTFVSFVVAMMQLLPALKRITNVNPTIQRGIAAGIGLFELLDLPEEKDQPTQAFAQARVNGEVIFHNVSFVYPASEQTVLHQINLTIKPGQNIAIVGSSGSGKTTLASLLPRFYEPTAGHISIDGMDIKTVSLSSLRAQLALVGQHVVLFNDTVANNIAYGCRDHITMEAIRAAAKAAFAHEFIEKLPQGYDTLVGENGALLSGGQRQRIAIARALLRDAPILILDEATSALDTESERHIQAALAVLMQNRTTLVIAHRLSTIEKADYILVMSEGRIVETGHHAALLAADGLYARLHGMQFRDTANTSN
jgi:ATP-binding cassette, subfamily B, bacterial MsbA